MNSKKKTLIFSVLIVAICCLLIYLIYHKVYLGNSSNSYSSPKVLQTDIENPENVLDDADGIYSKSNRKKMRYKNISLKLF